MVLKNEMKYSQLLEKQIRKTGISKQIVKPEFHDYWDKFLKKIDQTYIGYEKERYLLDRMIETSSKEMRELNQRLISAQYVAKLGYWMFSLESKKFMWVSGLDKLLNINLINVNEKYREIISNLDEENAAKFKKFGYEISNSNLESEVELYFKDDEGDDRYFLIKAVNKIEPNNKYSSGIILDITDRKLIEIEKEKMQSTLLKISRDAGMSEVAGIMLHNVGNLLNSARVSIDSIYEMQQLSSIHRLTNVSKNIRKHIELNDNWLLEDPKGKYYPEYLCELSEKIIMDTDLMKNEINNIHKVLEHIKHIVSMQRSIGPASNINENININMLIESCIQVSGLQPNNKHCITVEILTESDDMLIYSDKSKILQILVNLFNNAKEAILEKESTINRKITVSAFFIKENKSMLQISAKDNGVGIKPSIINKIFTMGFTTKPNGHGFGMHGSANTAKELNGSLKVLSDGEDKGAEFILQIQTKNQSE